MDHLQMLLGVLVLNFKLVYFIPQFDLLLHRMVQFGLNKLLGTLEGCNLTRRDIRNLKVAN